MEKKQLVKFEQVKDTPFQLVKAEDKYYITIGGKRACQQTFELKNEATKFVRKKPWELIASMIALIVERYEESKELCNSQNTNNQKTK